MVFSSVEFVYFFLPLALAGYFAMPKRLKNAWLFFSGMIFYAFGEPVGVVLLLISCAINYFSGIFLDKFDAFPKKRRVVLIISVAVNLGILAVFKYTAFITGLINSVTGLNIPLNPYAGIANVVFGTHFSLSAIALPIGISFFTFQSMSYTIDLYLRNIAVQKNFIDFSAYVTMFPQIVAGPIVRYRDISERLGERKVTAEALSKGVSRFCRGLAKKVLLANNVGILWERIKSADYSSLPVLSAWLGIAAFTFQIYFDFSGYSDMAIGMGKMLGFEFPENFDLPYTSRSVREFWRRWHITLGEWFKNYLYIPLGGSRKGMLKTVRNLAIVWLLTGLWHGASLNFLLWGCWFGILIILERLFLGKILEKLPGIVSWLYTIFAVVLGWVLFDTDDIPSAFAFMRAMFGAGGAVYDNNTLFLICEYSLTLSLCIYFSSAAPKNFREKIEERLNRAGLKLSIFEITEPFVSLTLLIASTAYLVNQNYNPFLYFNF